MQEFITTFISASYLNLLYDIVLISDARIKTIFLATSYFHLIVNLGPFTYARISNFFLATSYFDLIDDCGLLRKANLKSHFSQPLISSKAREKGIYRIYPKMDSTLWIRGIQHRK